MAKKKNWIAEATAEHKGSFKRAAERKGETTAEYAAEVLQPGSKASSTTKKKAQLAQTLAKMHHPKKK
jgi:hypothetical protein